LDSGNDENNILVFAIFSALGEVLEALDTFLLFKRNLRYTEF